MSPFKRVFCAILVVGLAGCATGEKIGRLQPGMSKAAAEKAMGRPDSFRTEGTEEIYVYSNRMMSGWSWDRADYVLRFKNGALTAYGPENVVHRQYVPPSEPVYAPPPPAPVVFQPVATALPSSDPLPPPRPEYRMPTGYEQPVEASRPVQPPPAYVGPKAAEMVMRPAPGPLTPNPSFPSEAQLKMSSSPTGRTQMGSDGKTWYEYARPDGSRYWSNVSPSR